ncbi:CreA family protein (plasmid) [Burkholderia sp. KK1]|nr:CreA family protein [Burkholderia sp. KK1]
MIRLFPGRASIVVALLIVPFSAAVAKELARIETHTQRYGSHIVISAYNDPLVRGVTCYVSRSHSNGALGGGRIAGAIDASASCQQTGAISVAETVPPQAPVFTADIDSTFGSLHIIRVLDTERRSLVYFSYSEDEAAGNLPGHLFVIRLPAGSRMPPR